MSSEEEPHFDRWEGVAWKIGFGALFLLFVGLWFDRSQAFQSYWFAWIFFTGLGCGSLAILLLLKLTGGAWGRAIQPVAEAAILTLPLMALLLVPALFGLPKIFPWANPTSRWSTSAKATENSRSVKDFQRPPAGSNVRPSSEHATTVAESAGEHSFTHKRAYLTRTWFTIRAAAYLAISIGLGLVLRGLTPRQEQPRVARFLSTLSGPGLVGYVLCMNFASADWVMSLEPEWFSTMLAVIFIVSQFLSALALGIVAVIALANARGVTLTTKELHDLGNLLLAFVIFLIYVSFSQFLIIWSGNLPREIAWYLPRSQGGWQYVAMGLALLQFAIPFALLLSREAKRHQQRLAPIAGLVLFSSVVNAFWLVAPTYHRDSFHLDWLDPVAVLTIGAFWLVVFLKALRRRPLRLPEIDLHATHG